MDYPSNERIVLFVDMLGVKAMIEAEPSAIGGIGPAPGSGFLPKSRTVGAFLNHRFWHFHSAIEDRMHRLKLDRTVVTAIVFSDSAYFAFPPHNQRPLLFAADLMRTFLLYDIPVRMGIASGSFRLLRSMSDASSETQLHSVQFLGMGVVQAYEAEHAGYEGLHVVLHKSCDMNWPADGPSPLTLNPALPQILGELNYLDRYTDDGDIKIFDAVARMLKQAPERKQHYYMNTFVSLNRMRNQYGREPIDGVALTTRHPGW